MQSSTIFNVFHDVASQQPVITGFDKPSAPFRFAVHGLTSFSSDIFLAFGGSLFPPLSWIEALPGSVLQLAMDDHIPHEH